jgi:hypothetical protein
MGLVPSVWPAVAIVSVIIDHIGGRNALPMVAYRREGCPTDGSMTWTGINAGKHQRSSQTSRDHSTVKSNSALPLSNSSLIAVAHARGR